MTDSYFNTTHLEGSELTEARLSSLTQEERVIAAMRQYARPLAPSQILSIAFPSGSVPVTSVRRAISVLTSKGVLEKTDEYWVGPFGKREHRWRLVRSKKPVQRDWLSSEADA